MPVTTSARLRHTRRGFTLVEVLVTLAVVAVGLLGFASLCIGGQRESRAALQHTRATLLAADLAERIRANRGAAEAYGLALGTDAPPATGNCAVAGECTAADLAAFDLHAWQQDARAALPEAATQVDVSVGADGSRMCRITLSWTSTARSTPSASLSLVLLA